MIHKVTKKINHTLLSSSY